jgi:integrase
MKGQNIHYIPKKSKVLSVEQCRKFILEASDDYLLCKVVVVFGLYGACRRDELLKLTVDDVEDHEKYILVKLHDTKTYTSRSFIIPDAQESLNPYDIYKKYVKLRPHHVASRRFFLGYQHGKCIAQPAGMHTIGGVPRKVAEFLGLDHPESYTGHCLRRSGASMVAESSGNLLPVKQIGGWKSSKVAEAYIEETITSKMKVANMILSTNNSDEVPAATSSSQETKIIRKGCEGSGDLVFRDNFNCTINVHMCKHDCL